MTNILLAILLGSVAGPFEAHTLDGRTLTGPLVELSADRATILTAGGRRSLETDKLLTLSQKRQSKPLPPAAAAVVELIDGSLIKANQYVVRGSQAQITIAGGEIVEAPTSAIRTVQFHPSAEFNSEWLRLLEAMADSDLLVVRTDGSLDAHKGVLHDVTEDAVRFDLDGEILPVRRSKLYGLAYRHSVAAELPPAVCRITDSAGSQWSVRSLTLSEKLQWATPAGLAVSQPLQNIAEIDFSGGKLVYLSDLKPESSVWTPLFAAEKPLPAVKRFYAPRFDRGFDSTGLELAGVHYAKGLALHARTELVYRLPAGFRRFLATAGIDDAARPAGKVRLVFRGDDKLLWEAEIAGGLAPQTIELDVAGIRRLTVQVDFAGSLTAGDRLLLCNARIVK
jgi:hypothetical protein